MNIFYHIRTLTKGLIVIIVGVYLNSCQPVNNQLLDNSNDFTVQFRIKTTSPEPTVLLSQKLFPDKSIKSQKNKGWVLYSSGGTFAWSVGSGDRRLNYERDNGDKMPLNDGQWHQISMTYSKELSEFRIYYDGHNKAIYKVEFDFSNDMPLQIGTEEGDLITGDEILPQILEGASLLQDLVNEYTAHSYAKLENEEFLDLIVDPDRLEEKKELEPADLSAIKDIRNILLKNPYTVYQIMELTLIKPISKIYYLDNEKVMINESVAQSYTRQTRLSPSDFKMKNLVVADRVLSADEIMADFNKFGNTASFPLETNKNELNVGVWNIWHGGIHWNVADDGWDSRMRIVEMIRENDIDVVLMQETYSSGDFIAAELGYYFLAASDWDYCFQGSNISVISRYPIKEAFVPFEASFMNVGALLTISETQEINAIANWYGMTSFPLVYDFHLPRFNNADKIPVLFGGDFNAVPHTDGGNSPASLKMIENGFTDAYRSLHPDVERYPGYSHNSGKRIDQLYFKGKALKNISSEMISDWPGGFPSDHFMIFSKFDLEYSDENNNLTIMKDTTPKVTGIGGIFFKSEDPEKIKSWYGENLGLAVNDWGSAFEFRNANNPDEINYLSWSPFSDSTDYFNPSKKEFMVNYRVQNLEGLVEKLRSNGVTIVDQIEEYDYGKFIHIMDPDGNKIELWEPVDKVFTEMGGETTK